MLYHQRAAVESVSDEDAGQGLKAAFRYFDGGDVKPEDLTPQAFTVFLLCAHILMNLSEIMKNQHQMGEKTQQKDGVTGQNSPPIGYDTLPIAK